MLPEHNNYIYFHHGIHPAFSSALIEKKYYDEYDIKRALNRGVLKVVSKEQLAKQQVVQFQETRDPPRRDFYRLNPIILSYGWNAKKDEQAKLLRERQGDAPADKSKTDSKEKIANEDKPFNVVIQNSKQPFTQISPISRKVNIQASLRTATLSTASLPTTRCTLATVHRSW